MNKKQHLDMDWGSRRRISLWYRSEISKVASQREQHLGKRSGNRQVMPFHTSPFQPLQRWLDFSMQKGPVGSLISFNIKSSWEQLQSLLFSPKCPERRQSQQLDTAHDFCCGAVGLVLPSLSNLCFWKQRCCQICSNTPKDTWKASSAPSKKIITQHCLKHHYNCHSSSQGICG